MAQAKDRRLYDAVCNNNLDEVLKLLNEGVNLEDTFDDFGRTPLMQAFCYIDVTNIPLALIEKGANVNARDKRGNTGLMFASFRGNNSVATSLIRNGADINAVNIYGNTALAIACRNGAVKTALILIENGANVNIRTNENVSPLHLACMKNLEDVFVSLLHNGAVVNEVDKDGNTSLHLACKNGRRSMALFHIEIGANVNMRNNQNRSPLLLACVNNLTDVVVSLIHTGADVNEVIKDGNTVLHLACQNRKADLALILIQNGANVTLRNKDDRSPLSFACEMALSDVIVSLIRNGAEVNESCGLKNETALHYAATKNHKDIIGMLLNNGADIFPLTKNGKTPLQLALENQSTEAVEVIRRYAERSANKTKSNPAPSSVSNKSDDVVKMIKNVEKGLEKVNQNLVQFDKTLRTILTRLEHLESKAKSNDQENFENVLEIAGIESKENEDLVFILLRLATILGLSLQDKANIISIHRPIKISPACSATNCSNVIEVKFRTLKTTQNWLKAFKDKRSLGITASALNPSLKSEKIFVNQKLTLLHRAKEFAKDKGYNFIWFQDGKIFLRKDENSRVIRIERDIDIMTLKSLEL